MEQASLVGKAMTIKPSTLPTEPEQLASEQAPVVDLEASPTKVISTSTDSSLGQSEDVITATVTDVCSAHRDYVHAIPIERDDIVEAQVVTEDEIQKERKSKQIIAIFTITCLVVLALVVTLPAVLIPQKAGYEETPTIAPTVDDSERRELLRSILVPVSGSDVFDDESPEFSADRSAALDWLVQQDRKLPFKLDDGKNEWHIRQLYVAALFYFATDGQDWDEQFRFFSGPFECDWTSVTSQLRCEDSGCVFSWVDTEESELDVRGIICNEHGRITRLRLWWNNLSGTLPHELTYLNETLVELNLGGGSVTGSIPSKFTSLTKLNTLSLNDHCLSGTIPDFSSMSSLTKIFLHNNNDLYGSLNDFCEGSSLKEGIVGVAGDCGCSRSTSKPSVECDCCLCCDQDRFECCSKEWNQTWSSINFSELTSEGFLQSFEKPCLSEKSQQFIQDECPCYYDSGAEASLFDQPACTTNCSIERALPTHSLSFS